MDKVIYLVDKNYYRKEVVEPLTQKDLEEWVAEEDYDDDRTIMKIDANAYDTVHQALGEEMGYLNILDIEDEYWVMAFGF